MNIIKIKQNKHIINSYNDKLRSIKEIEDGLDTNVLIKQILIKGENKRIFSDYALKIIKITVTHSKIEEDFLKTYIFSGWKLRRLRELERNYLNRQQGIETDTFFGPEEKTKKRIRDISKINIDDWVKENNIAQDKLKKEMSKALKQLREEQKVNK